MFNSLRPTTVLECLSAVVSRWSFPARFVAFVILSGTLSVALGQARPVEPAGSDAAAGQNQAGGADQGQASAAVDSGHAPGLIRLVPFGRGGLVKSAIPIPSGTQLKYWGGPVISQVHVVAVFWGPNVNTAITGAGGIDQFFTDITSSRYFDLLTEYSTVGVTGVGVPATSSNQSIQRGVFDQKVTISPSLCANATILAPCTLTDLQVQQELGRQINAGALPQPVSDAQGNIESFYMIYFPPGVTINLATAVSCVQFCAYHSNTDTPVTPRFVPYGVLPDFAPPSGCSRGCGAGSLFQNVTAVTSHELSEAVTDALVGLQPQQLLRLPGMIRIRFLGLRLTWVKSATFAWALTSTSLLGAIPMSSNRSSLTFAVAA